MSVHGERAEKVVLTKSMIMHKNIFGQALTRAARACLPRIDTTSGGSYARQGTVSSTSQARSSG